MYWLTKWYEILRLLVKLHDIVCADFGNFLIHRMVQGASTIRKNQLPCLDLILRIFFRFVECYWARLPFVECYNSCDSDHSYLNCKIIVYTVYSKTADWSLSTTLECVLFGILWLFLGACVEMYVSQTQGKPLTRDQRISENPFLLIRKMTFYQPPPWGGGGVSKILGLKA